MPYMRPAVGGRRAIKEGEVFSAFPVYHAFFKNVVFFPEPAHLAFAFNELQVSGHLVVHLLSPKAKRLLTQL
jgi:hypothetical protein